MKKGNLHCLFPFFIEGLLPQVQFFNDASVTLNVFILEVVQKASSLTYQPDQRLLCVEVLAVVLQVFGKVGNSIRKECDLSFGRS